MLREISYVIKLDETKHLKIVYEVWLNFAKKIKEGMIL